MDVDDSERTQLVAIALSVLLLLGTLGAVVVAVSGGVDVETRPGEPGDATALVDRLHETGLTGDGVRVGVVVATGVDASRSSLRDQVVSARSFGSDDAGNDPHGTATADVVARTAPDAELYVASFDTATGFAAAMDWLSREGVDVVVAPVSFYGRPGDGSSRVARVADRVASNGSVVVAPVGNVGAGHWEGAFDPDRNGTHRFAGGPRNYLRATGERTASLWLSWNESGTAPRAAEASNFSLELHRQTGDGSRLVARSRPFEGTHRRDEWLTARVRPGGTYYFVVDGPAGATATRLEISSPTHAFQYRERGGSVVAPATARRVLAVGAANATTGDPRPYSGAGPVDGVRPGVDVVADDRQPTPVLDGDFRGTSAASAYAAGVVALMLDANPNLSPKVVEAVVEATAVEAGPEGVDPVAGHGYLAAERAVERARNVST